MARRRLWRNHVVSLYWRTRHPLLRFLCLHEAVTLPFVVAIFWPKNLFQRSSICTSATASVELCSHRGEVPWSIAAVYCRACDSSLAKTHTVSALSAWVFRMHVTWFMGSRNAKFAHFRLITLRSRLEACEKESSIFPRRAPEAFAASREIVKPRPGVRILSSRRWRVSR